MWFNIHGEIQNDPEVTETVVVREGRKRLRQTALTFVTVLIIGVVTALFFEAVWMAMR